MSKKKTIKAKKDLPQNKDNFGKNVSQKQIKTIAAIVILTAVLYFAKGLFVAALVNGKPISRFAVVSQLEKQGGKNVLDSLIVDTLIQNEAEKRKIKIDQKEVDAQLATIQKNVESQGSTLDQALASQGMTKDQLTEQIKLQTMLNKMVNQNVMISDKEIDDYINSNKDQLPQTDSASLRSQVKKQLTSQKIDQETQKFIQDLRSKANITYFVNY